MQKTIRNNTPNELVITGADGRQIALAPLELREFKEEDVTGFDFSEASHAGTITVRTVPPSELAAKIFGSLFGLGFMVGIGCVVLSSYPTPKWFPESLSWKWTIWIAGVVSLFVAAVVIFFKERKEAIGVVSRIIAQTVSLFFILAIGFGLPAATVYYFGEGRALIANPSTKLFVRLLQVGFIATASLMPVILFFWFDRYQINTLRNRLYRDLFRLDRGLTTRSEIDAKYGSQIEEAYGPEDQGRGRLTRGTRWPVLVCAFVMTMGWLAAFKPIGEVTADSVLRPLFPERTVLTFGFLGAYFFGLQLIARRYARGDLKPKAYGYITIRILIIAVLSWVLQVFSEDSSVTLVTAFLIGILPDELFTLIKENFRGRTVARLVPQSENHPLTKLEGIDLYDRARLEQEGIVNVESFAHHDLIHLVLETRIPVPQLVDWMDQAILYLHIIEGQRNDEPSDDEPNNVGANHENKKETTRERLRAYGIRTATDFLFCWKAAEMRNELDDFKMLLGGADKPYRLEVIRDSMLDDEWLHHVKDWRNDADREKLEIDAKLKTYEAMLEWAQTLENERKYTAAITMLKEALKVCDDAMPRLRLANLFATVPVKSLRDVKSYRENAQRAFELGQKNVDILSELIDIYETSGDIDDAIRVCDSAILAMGDVKGDKAKAARLDEFKKRMGALQMKIASQV